MIERAMSRDVTQPVPFRNHTVTVRPQHCPLKLNKIHNLYVKCNTARLLGSRRGIYVQRTVHPPLLGNLYFVTCYNPLSLLAAQKIDAVIVFSSSSFKLANKWQPRKISPLVGYTQRISSYPFVAYAWRLCWWNSLHCHLAREALLATFE